MLFAKTEIPAVVSESYSILRLHYPRGEPFLAAFATLLVLIGVYLIDLERSDDHLRQLPWAGRRHESFSKIRACFREYRSGWKTLKEGQEKFLNNGIPFILPQSTFKPIIIVPQDYLKWMMKQPETVLSAIDVQRELVGFQHIIPWSVSETCQYLSGAIINTMRTSLKSSDILLQRTMVDQVVQCVDGWLGFDDVQWKNVNLFDFMNKVTYQVSLQVWIGESLYHNQDVLYAFENFGWWLSSSAVVLSSWTPPVFTNIIGLLLRIPLNITINRCRKHVLPVVRKRWEQLERLREHSSTCLDDDIPNDFLTWTVKAAMGQKYSKISCPEHISEILVLTGASALSTSGTVGTHVLLDLLSSNPSYIQRLCLEVEEVFAESTDTMDSCLLGKLSYIDSAIRESLRLNPIIAIEPRRKIVPPTGVTLPNGVHLPQNTWIGLSFLDVHFNENNYPDAKEYRPFRFVEINQERALKAGIEGKSVEGSDTMIVSTGSNFIGFGAGRHTCPGRWLAATQLKLIIAYMVLHYDIKPLIHRPYNQKIGVFNVPNRQAKIQVRRREVKAGSDLEKIQGRFQSLMLSVKSNPSSVK